MALSVVYVGHTAVLSGAEIQFARLVPRLAERVEVRVVLASDGPMVPLLRDQGLPVTVLELSEAVASVRRATVDSRHLPAAAAIGSALWARRLARMLRSEPPDVVHTLSLKSAFLGGLGGRLAGVPCVWGINDLIDRPYLSTAATRLVKVAAQVLPAGVVTNSRTTLEALGSLPVPATVIYPPAPDGRRATGGAALPATRGPLTVAMVGRLAPWKGQEVFLDAFAMAFPDGPEVAVVIGSALFGEDDYAEGLRRRAAALGIATRVRFTGFSDDVKTLVAASDMVVHASVSPEPFGQVIVEAMAAGTAVIAADAGGPREIITDGEDGLLCAPGDVAAYAASMRRLADDPALRGRLAATATARLDRFDPDDLADGLAAFYQRVCRP